jgi:aminomethyltransferase
MTVDGETKLGNVTSGGPSPTLNEHIAMGYIDWAHRKAGTPVMMMVRGKLRPAIVAKMPFVETKYFR